MGYTILAAERPDDSGHLSGVSRGGAPLPETVCGEFVPMAMARGGMHHSKVHTSKLGPVLETPRLILRPPENEDFEAFCGFASDPEVARFIGAVAEPQSVWRAMKTLAGCWALDGFAMFSVLEKESGRWIGRLGPWMPWGWPGTEIGWGLVRDAWGKGYATEGSVAAIDWAIESLGWSDIIHCIDPANTPSQEVARRLGSVNRGAGKLPAPFADAPIEIWGQSAEEWRARRKRGEPKR